MNQLNRMNQSSIITEEIEFLIRDGIREAVNNRNSEAFSELTFFVKELLRDSMLKNDKDTFSRYRFLPVYVYHWKYNIIKNDALGVKENIGEDLFISKWLRDFIVYQFRYLGKKKDSYYLDKENFIYWIFECFSQVLYYSLMNKDFKSFKTFLRDFYQINIEPENFNLKIKIKEIREGNLDENLDKFLKKYKNEEVVNSYRRKCAFGIKAWTANLYKEDFLSQEEFKELWSLYSIDSYDTEVILSEFLEMRQEADQIGGFMSWRDWKIKEEDENQVYWSSGAAPWLDFGFLLDQIEHFRINLFPGDYKNIGVEDSKYLHDTLLRQKDILLLDSDKWINVLKIQDIEGLESSIDRVTSVFERLYLEENLDNYRIVASLDLDQNKVDSFKKEVGDRYDQYSKIVNMFNQYKNTEDVGSRKPTVFIGDTRFLIKGKQMFIDDDKLSISITGLSDIGCEVGRKEDIFFFESILKEINEIETANSVVECLNTQIAHLKSNNFIPNVIFMCFEDIHMGNLDDSILFERITPKETESKEQKIPVKVGFFDGIPIYIDHYSKLKGKALVCSFENAFRMNYRSNDSWYRNVLNTSVELVTEEKANAKFDEKPEYWLKYDGNELNKTQAISLIQTSVIINIHTMRSFEIINENALSVMSFKR